MGSGSSKKKKKKGKKGQGGPDPDAEHKRTLIKVCLTIYTQINQIN